MIAIVDYRAGNLSSVARALAFLGHACEITDRPDAVARAERVILPGVGAAGATMENLRALGLDQVLTEQVIGAGKPFLGICIGIQVLLDSSEENDAKCLGVIPGRALRFPATTDGVRLKVPQIGWNRVNLLREHPLFDGIPDGTYFYFVNSYYPDLVDSGDAVALADYGVRFVAALARGPVMATQFHLEKSGGAGLRMLDNFCRYQAGRDAL
jgi:glutamine amidotransferase